MTKQNISFLFRLHIFPNIIICIYNYLYVIVFNHLYLYWLDIYCLLYLKINGVRRRKYHTMLIIIDIFRELNIYKNDKSMIF